MVDKRETASGTLDGVGWIRFPEVPGAEQVQVTAHLRGPSLFEAQIIYQDMYLVTMVLAAADGTYGLRRLSFDAHPDAAPLTATSINAFPVATLQRDLSWMELGSKVKWGTKNESDVLMAITDRLEPGKRPRPTSDMLELVAVYYEYCQITGMPAVKRLQRILGIPQSTVAHWVRLAKDRGFLEEDHQPLKRARQFIDNRGSDDPAEVFSQWSSSEPIG